MSTDSPRLFGEMRWDTSELAEALVLTPQRVTQLSKENVIPHPVAGSYQPIPAVAAYVTYLRQRETVKSSSGELVKKLQLDNELRSIRLQKIAGSLVSADQVASDWFETARRTRDAMLNISSRLAGPVSAESDQNKVFNMLNKEINQALTELSSGQTGQPVVESLPMDGVSEPSRSLDDEPGAAGDTELRIPDEEPERETERATDRFSSGD